MFALCSWTLMFYLSLKIILNMKAGELFEIQRAEPIQNQTIIAIQGLFRNPNKI